MPSEKTWSDVLKSQPMVVALVIMTQFFALIVIFAFWAVNMDSTAKSTILQTYVIAFTASWGFFIGSSTGSKSKDGIIARSQPVVEPPVPGAPTGVQK
jgi:hypothetical protein